MLTEHEIHILAGVLLDLDLRRGCIRRASSNRKKFQIVMTDKYSDGARSQLVSLERRKFKDDSSRCDKPK